MELQIGLLDIIAVGITVVFAVKGNKLRLSRIILMALTLLLVLVGNKLISFSDFQNNDIKNTLVVIGICFASFLVASNLMQKFLDKLIDTFISPSLNSLIGTIISTFIGLILASMVCYLALQAKPDIKTSSITEFYLNIANVVVAKAPEIANNVKEKTKTTTTNVNESVDNNSETLNEASELPSDIAKTIENIQNK